MPSQTDLLNEALARLGAERIDAIDDGSINANYCNTIYPGTRDALLQMSHWKFASTRAILVLDAVPPLFQYEFAYVLPEDLLQIHEYNGGPVNSAGLTLWYGQWFSRYIIEGKRLLTNDTSAYITYVRRVEDCTLWRPNFYQTCVAMLAAKLAGPITKDEKMSSTLWREAMTIHLPMALALDGQEGTVQPFVSNDLTRGR